MMFKDRKDAGIQLAEALNKYKGEDVIVFALPRGGVVLGAEIARSLNAPLDLIIVKKIGHPMNPEYAICAVVENGEPVCNENEIDTVDKEWFDEEVKRIRVEIKRRRDKYLGGLAPHEVEGKTVIIVDDGIATGLTTIAAIEAIKKSNPKRVIVAIPVTPYDTAKKLEKMVDELVSLEIDRYFIGAVGAYYENFRQVEDSEVISILNEVKNKR